MYTAPETLQKKSMRTSMPSAARHTRMLLFSKICCYCFDELTGLLNLSPRVPCHVINRSKINFLQTLNIITRLL